jgi:class 3 adenylate cyclase
LRAFDIAEAELGRHPDALLVKHALVLALARAGATKHALTRYRELGLDMPGGCLGSSPEAMDVAALGARLAKDVAMRSQVATRVAALRDAAASYNAIFATSGDFYPGINAASLTCQSGDGHRAAQLAETVLAACRTARTEKGVSYYLLATEAEAYLLLGDRNAAAKALADAAALAENLSDIAATRKQLRMVCEATGNDPDILRALRVPTVVHFTGHNIGLRFSPDAENAVAQRIADTLAAHDIGIGYGALAGGADILIAEAILRAGGELNVVLPFGIDEFKRISVEASGPAWLDRFDQCLAAARSVEFATTDDFLGDTSLFAYASQLAMGLALLRASYLSNEARQLAVWDGRELRDGSDDYGTGGDIRYWRTRGHTTDVIAPDLPNDAAVPDESCTPASPPAEPRGQRVVRAMLFGDVAGFGSLREAQLPIFLREVLGRFAKVLDRYGDQILYRNSWGDGLFVVTHDAEAAARCALDLQDAVSEVQPNAHGLAGYAGLRLGAHVGPVFELLDPVLGRSTFLGVHVSRAARIEPITPVGAVYVTEAFAAALAAQRDSPFVCEYVGQVSTAKDHERMRMYSLRRLWPASGATP